jgi:hypothetical protein
VLLLAACSPVLTPQQRRKELPVELLRQTTRSSRSSTSTAAAKHPLPRLPPMHAAVCIHTTCTAPTPANSMLLLLLLLQERVQQRAEDSTWLLRKVGWGAAGCRTVCILC